MGSAHHLRDLGPTHVVDLDAIARGEADEEILWQMLGGVLPWSKVAELLDVGVPETNELAKEVVQRYGRTGRVGYSGLDYQLANEGLDVMDALVPTAITAADWSENMLNKMSAGAEEGMAA